MVEWLFSLLFYCESGINQYPWQKTLTDLSGANHLLLELSCFRNSAFIPLESFLSE